MDPADPEDLTAIVERELKRLPAPRAPYTLLPRVMASVQEWARRPWYSREWLTWPVALQVASAAALVLLIVGAEMVLPGARGAAVDVLNRATGSDMAAALAWVSSGGQSLVIAVQTTALVVRAVVEPLLPYVFVVVMLMCLACAAFATALDRVVKGTVTFTVSR